MYTVLEEHIFFPATPKNAGISAMYVTTLYQKQIS
jgi:hypothetical protein